MHLSHLAAAAVAAVGSSYALESMLPASGVSATVRNEIEVVYRAPASLYCPGCKATYTDNVPDSGITWDCPSGDRWLFTVETPVTSDAVCNPMGYLCVESGDCKFDRKGVLSFIDSGLGPCPIFYRWNEEARYFEGSHAEEFDMAMNVTCKVGAPSQKVCKTETVTFYDNKTANGNIVLEWVVEFCCSKCLD
ncbi:MAG: hypothetical protein NXI31_19605 [bacterium]|nr:hypothetical protein [bacterium]